MPISGRGGIKVRPPTSRNVQSSSSAYFLSPSALLIGGTSLPTAAMSNFWTRELHSADNEKLPNIDRKPSFSVRGHRAKSLPVVSSRSAHARQKGQRHSWSESIFATHVKPIDDHKINSVIAKGVEARPTKSWDKNGRRHVQFTAVPTLDDVNKGLDRFHASHNAQVSQIVDETLRCDGEESEMTPVMRVTMNRKSQQTVADGIKQDILKRKISAEAWCKRYLGQQRLKIVKPPLQTSTTNEYTKPQQDSTSIKQSDTAGKEQNERTTSRYTTTCNHGMPAEHINYCDVTKTERIKRWLKEVNDETKVYEKIHGKWAGTPRESE